MSCEELLRTFLSNDIVKIILFDYCPNAMDMIRKKLWPVIPQDIRDRIGYIDQIPFLDLLYQIRTTPKSEKIPAPALFHFNNHYMQIEESGDEISVWHLRTKSYILPVRQIHTVEWFKKDTMSYDDCYMDYLRLVNSNTKYSNGREDHIVRSLVSFMIVLMVNNEF